MTWGLKQQELVDKKEKEDMLVNGATQVISTSKYCMHALNKY